MPDPQTVPDVQQVVDDLLAGVPPTPAGDEPAAAAPPSPGEGFRFEEPTPRTTPQPAPAAPAVDPSVLREVQQLRDDLRREQERVAANQGNYHRADQQRQQAEAIAQALVDARQREMAIYQQAAALQPPQFDGEELLTDGQRLAAALQQMGQHTQAWVAAQFGPYAQTIAQLQGTVQAQQAVARRMARSEAKRMVEERLGGQDFDQVYPQLETILQANGPAGQQMLLDPDNIFRAYALQKLESGGNPLASKRAPAPPPSADPRPAVTPAPNRAKLAEIAPMARNVARTLGLGDDLPVTAADLARVGLG